MCSVCLVQQHPSLSHVSQEPVEDVHKFSCAYAPIQCCEIYLCKTTQSGFHLEGTTCCPPPMKQPHQNIITLAVPSQHHKWLLPNAVICYLCNLINIHTNKVSVHTNSESRQRKEPMQPHDWQLKAWLRVHYGINNVQRQSK